MNGTLDIERFDDLLRYLRERGHLRREEVPAFTNLRGGISNRTVAVERPDGRAYVLKQALEKLRVQADWRSEPRRSHQEALGLVWLERLTPPGTITPLLFEDATQHLLAMQAVSRPHENWKTRLLSGGLETRHVQQFAQCLGDIHRRSHEQPEEISVLFDDRTFFETLRLEPYYRYTAARNPATVRFFENLIAETLATRVSLVHGDFSPKNILIHQDKLVLLDHEVIHFGDPAFDIGFSLTHLLSKAHHLAEQREAFLNAGQFYWQTYQQTVGRLAAPPDFAARAARHTLGCLLGRVDGRSPLEYLSQPERDRQRTLVLSLIAQVPTNVPELIQRFGDELQ